MAVWTDTELVENVLSYLSVKATGQPVNADDDNLVKRIYTSVYAQMRTAGYAPFKYDEVPEWAWWPLVKWLAVEAGPTFGKFLPAALREEGKTELRATLTTEKPPMPVRAKYY